MTNEFASKLAQPYLSKDDVKTLCILGDGGVYLNNDIAVMRQNALDRNVKIFVFKGETEKLNEVVSETKEEVAEPKSEVEKPTKSNKKK
jgi:hypothetical protein